MVKNKQQIMQWVTMLFFVVLILCTTALSFEYYFFCQQTRDVLALKREYRMYVSAAKRSLVNQRGFVGEDLVVVNGSSSDSMTDSFIPVRRNVSYLKDCMVRYFKDQQLEALIHDVGLGHWDHECDKKIAVPFVGSNIKNKKKSKQMLHKTKIRSIPHNNVIIDADYDELVGKKKTFFHGLSNHLNFG